jgi:ABC-2 type transport system ATP-binding protein
VSGPSVEVIELTKRFGKRRPAVQDLSFRFEGNGAIGYLGPNGAGKSTTLKLLVGLLRPTSGQALLNGFDPVNDRKHALADVGAVIESPEPYSTMTVFGALETVGALRGLDPETVDSEIDRWHAELDLPALGARCGRLSKGERQRVVLAAGLMGDPSVLLLDEPTSGLDPAERVLVRNLLGRLKKDHLVLMSSHLMGDITEVCDELVFLRRGKVVLRDRVDAVAARISMRQLDVEFLEPTPRSALEGMAPMVEAVVEITDRRFRLTFNGSRVARAQVLDQCRQIAPLVRFTDATLVLEEAYLDVIASAREE